MTKTRIKIKRNYSKDAYFEISFHFLLLFIDLNHEKNFINKIIKQQNCLTNIEKNMYWYIVVKANE
jgi:hypothetical protein